MGKIHGCLLPALLIALALLVVPGGRDRAALLENVSAAAHPVQRLSREGEDQLRALLALGEIHELKSPSFGERRSQVESFYASRGYSLAWISVGRPTPQALSLITMFQNAGAKGLNPDDYDVRLWSERLAALGRPGAAAENEAVRFDLAFTVSLLRYIVHLHCGRVNPHQIGFDITVAHQAFDGAEVLRKLVDANDVEAVVQEVEPPFAIYQRLEKALAAYVEAAREDDVEPLPALQKTLEPGGTYNGMPRLVRLLRRTGDLPPDAAISPDSTVYAGPAVEAVKRFQQRHGLEADGRIARDTLRQLNVPLSQRVVQLQLSLERWRWLPRQFSQPPIVVNIPEFKLRALDELYTPALTMRVIVGKAYHHRTPVFGQAMRYVIFHPYWEVPPSIQRAEIVPAMLKDANYLSKHGYEVVDARTRRAAGADEGYIQALRSGRLAVRQRPGAHNSLGLVKFVFPNQHDVYMHGTPSVELFKKARRDFSHGCIRVEDPEALAVWVLRSNPEWTRERIRAAMETSRTQTVTLSKPLPVLIMYATALVPASGEVLFFDDIYGHDAALQRLLAKGYPYTPAADSDYQRRTRPTSTWMKSELR